MKEDWKDIITEERWQKWAPFATNVLVPLAFALFGFGLMAITVVLANGKISEVIAGLYAGAILMSLLGWAIRWFVFGLLYRFFSEHGQQLSREMQEEAKRKRDCEIDEFMELLKTADRGPLTEKERIKENNIGKSWSKGKGGSKRWSKW